MPSYGASNPSLLHLKMGSPAYEKYLQLKERQRRLKAAKDGKKPEPIREGEGLEGGSSVPLLVPPSSGMWRGDLMDYVTDARSMASLMSYTLGETC